MESPRRSNSRGLRSQEEILDAATRLMAVRGYAATSISVLSEETGLPKSAIYHHFRSKGGLLSAVMARGAHRFFAAMREAHAEPPSGGTPRDRLDWYLQRVGRVFLGRPDFLRLHLILMMSSEPEETEVAEMIADVRAEGRAYMNHMIRESFAAEGEQAAAAVADELDYFAIAGFDGAFVAMQADPSRSMPAQLSLLSEALAALGEARLARRRG